MRIGGIAGARAAGLLLAACLVSVSSAASAIDWTGATSTDWFTTSNWSSGSVPTTAVGVEIENPNANTPNIAGAAASAQSVSLGAGVGQAGTLTVSGAGAALNLSSYVLIGTSGHGTLTISNGATGSLGYVVIAQNSGSVGTLTVTGVGSSASFSGLSIGPVGGAGLLDVEAGAHASTTADAFVTGASGIDVKGAGSVLQTGSLHINNVGGDGLLVTAGGHVSSTSPQQTQTTTVQGTATVTGLGSLWSITGSWGVTTDGGTTSLLDGGAITSESAIITNGGKVTVSGKDAGSGTASSWTVAGPLTVAPSGKTGTLEVKGGGKVSVSTLTTIGDGTITVDGAGSAVTVTGGAAFSTAFSSSTGSTSITVSNGGSVIVGNQITPDVPTDFITSDIGSNIGSTTNVLVTGAGSSWTNAIGGMAVGEVGTGSLTIADGGHVTSGFLNIGRSTDLSGNPSTGAVTVTGAGSLLSLTDGVHRLEVGSAGNGTLKVLDGGEVQTNGVGLQMGAFQGQGEVLVDGTGSKLKTKGLDLGPFSAGKLTVSNGGRVEATGVSTGENPGIDGAKIIVDGGTIIANVNGVADFGDLTVGQNASASLVATHASTLTANGATLANGAGSTGVITLSDAGTTLTLVRQLIVGAGSGLPAPTSATMTVDTGAKVTVGSDLWIATSSAVTGTLNVRNTGSSVTAATLTVGGGFGNTGGTGKLVIADSASVAITGAARILAAGTLQIGEGAAPGTFSAASLADGGALKFNHTGTLIVSAPISGAGSIVQAGSGTTTLGGTSSSFTGTISVDAGRLNVNGAFASTATTTVKSGATLAGIGSLGATTILAGGNLVGASGQTLSTGTLVLNGTSNLFLTLGTAPASALFSVAGDLTLDGVASVSAVGGFGAGLYRIVHYTGSLTDNGLSIGSMPAGFMPGDITVQTSVANEVNLLVGSSSASPQSFWNGTTTSPDGSVHGGNGTWTAGPVTNWVNEDGTQASAWLGVNTIFAGVAGTVNVDTGDGPVATTGMQFAVSGYAVSGDPVQIAGAGDVTDIRVGDGTVDGTNYVATISSGLSGTSGMRKTDLGKLILSGANTYTGATEVADGTLEIDGSIVNPNVIIDAGATLKGIGTIGDGTAGTTIILVGGIHAPGHSIGTQTINGNYANHGTLQIEVSPTLADKLVINGAVDITGATLALTESPLAGWDPTHDYTIIDNDGVDAVTGTFATVTDNFAFLDPSIIYNGGTGNDVVLTITRNAVSFASTALTPNQTAAANGAQSLGAGNPVYDAVALLSTSAAPTAFDQLSGEVYATLAGTLLTDSRIPRDAALDRVDAAFAALAADKQRHGRNIWTRMVGDVGVINGDGNAAAALTSTGGFLAGADDWLSGNLLLGGEAGVTFGGVSVADRNSTATVDSAHLGVYGGVDLDPLQLSFGAAISGHGAHVTRTPAFSGFSQTLDSDSAGLTAQLFGEIGYAFKGDAGTIEPFAGLALVHTDTGAYSETGGSAAVSGKGASIDAALLTVGVKASSDLVLPGDVKARAKALLGWQGTLAGTPTATHSFAHGTPFTVAGAPLDSHLVLDTDVEFDLPGTAKLDLGYHATLGAAGGHGAVLATLGGTF